MKIGELDLSKEMENMLHKPGAISRQEPGAIPFAPKQRQLSDQAAQAAQNMIDLQTEVERLRQEADVLRSHIRVIEETNVILVTELDTTKKNNESLMRENIVIHTRLRTAADIIVGIMKPLEAELETTVQPEETTG